MWYAMNMVWYQLQAPPSLGAGAARPSGAGSARLPRPRAEPLACMGGGIWVRPGPPSDLIRVWMVQGDGWCRRPAGVVGLDGPWGRGVLGLDPLGGSGWSLGTGCVRVQPQKGPPDPGGGADAVAGRSALWPSGVMG